MRQRCCCGSVDVLCEIVSDRPVDVVAGFAEDPTNAPRWYRNIELVTWLTDPPLRTGSAMTFVAHFLGRRLSHTYEVVELVPGANAWLFDRRGPVPRWRQVTSGRRSATWGLG